MKNTRNPYIKILEDEEAAIVRQLFSEAKQWLKGAEHSDTKEERDQCLEKLQMISRKLESIG